MQWVKDALHETAILPLLRPELFVRGNLAKPCTGVLLYGPPGTGKTLVSRPLATERASAVQPPRGRPQVCRALATECNAYFMNVTRASVASKWFGELEREI